MPQVHKYARDRSGQQRLERDRFGASGTLTQQQFHFSGQEACGLVKFPKQASSVGCCVACIARPCLELSSCIWVVAWV